MDWARAIEINQTALTRIVANLIAMVEFSLDGSQRLSRSFYRAVLLVLHPAESAVRRLIVIAARGIKVTSAPRRPGPGKPIAAGPGIGRMSFRLFDTRIPLGDTRPWGAGPKSIPRIRFVDADPPLVPLFQPPPPEISTQEPDGTVDTVRLTRRLAVLKLALETLPKQAQRMARWRARRALMPNPKFRSPMRPGRPPGHRKKPRDEVDLVLKECHALAWDALKEDTS